MIQVLATSWALLLGLMLLMLGNGMQGTLLGIRGGLEGFSTFQMSLIMSAYFVGFLGGSKMAPELIRRVGHVRVFSALGSFISAILILYPTLTDVWAWIVLRILIGFCFSAVYVTAESWLNNSVDNANRGKALSLYLIVQMAGIIAAQGLVALGDPSGFILFVIPSVLVSISFAPILLSVNPTPAFESTQAMTLRQLLKISPLGCMGVFMMGGVYAAQFGMASVYGAQAGLSVAQISTFIAAIYTGGLLFQYPIGWISDKMDRRVLICIVAALGGVIAGLGFVLDQFFTALLVISFLVGGLSNPLYGLLIAYTNDMMDPRDMAAASGGLLFINGMGAILGPIITGWVMGAIGPSGFWLIIAVLMIGIAIYGVWRMTRRRNPTRVEDTARYAAVLPSAGVVAFEAAQEVYAEHLEESGAEQASDRGT